MRRMKSKHICPITGKPHQYWVWDEDGVEYQECRHCHIRKRPIKLCGGNYRMHFAGSRVEYLEGGIK